MSEGYDIGTGIESIRRINPPKQEERQRGDRNFYQTQRLRGSCPKCKMVVPTVQRVTHHDGYGIIKHFCKYCSKELRIQRYPLTTVKQFEEQMEKAKIR